MKALLIEDEQPAARQLAKLLGELPEKIGVIEVLDSVAGAVNWLNTFPSPDLIFMDIQIADGLSFDIFRQVDVGAPVIFTTAFDQYAVQAFKVHALDYLLKPVDAAELATAVERVKIREQKRGISGDLELLSKLLSPVQYKSRFLVKSGAQMVFLESMDIAWFRSGDGLTQACTISGKKYFIDHSLDDLEQLLQPVEFFRISRGMILRASAIHKIHTHFNGRLKLEIAPKDEEETFVSRERVNGFKSWLGG